MNQAPALMNRPSRMVYKNLRFLILDAPTNENMQSYLGEMLDFKVTDLVRTCELTYDEDPINDHGIRTHPLVFNDGEAPTEEVIEKWLALLRDPGSKGIALHCVAGLGRAPVLVALALIEMGMAPLDAVTFIRERRRGAINKRQLQFLKMYRRRRHRRRICFCFWK